MNPELEKTAREIRSRFRRLKARVDLRREFSADRARYGRYAIPSDLHAPARLDGRGLETQLTKDYHRVEKGLALPEPKRPFGADVSLRLDRFLALADVESPYAAYATEARDALATWNAGGDADALMTIPGESLPPNPLSPDEAEDFFTGRRSVRNFDVSRPVAPETLRRAVELAVNTPSVCNRQSWSIRFFHGDRVREVLRHQNGNKGFVSTVGCAAVISVDNHLFAGLGERNQPWIEGGLFAMSFVWALHAEGVASCLLNWSQPNGATDRLRAECGIPDHESVITLLAIGYPAPGFRVARSPRRSADDVIR